MRKFLSLLEHGNIKKCKIDPPYCACDLIMSITDLCGVCYQLNHTCDMSFNIDSCASENEKLEFNQCFPVFE